MKKLVLVLLSALAVFALAACGGKETDDAVKWSDIFAASNYASYKVTVEMQWGGEEDVQNSDQFIDGKKVKSVQGNYESYLSEENGKTYQYSKQSDAWTKREITNGESVSVYTFQFLKDGEQDFTLTDGYYVCKAEKFLTYAKVLMGGGSLPDSVTGTFKFKIADNKLSELVMEAVDGEDSVTQKMVFSDYGKVSVTLPTVSETPAE